MAYFSSRLVQLKNKEEVQLRMADVSDALKIHEVMIQFAETSPYILSTADSRRARTLDSHVAWIRSSNDDEGSALILAEHRGHIIGVTNLVAFKDAKRKHRAGLGMTMAADYRGMGLGEAMLRKLIEIAEGISSLQFLELNVMEPNTAAYKLYSKLGFKECGRYSKAYLLETGEYVDDIAMYLPLQKGLEGLSYVTT